MNLLHELKLRFAAALRDLVDDPTPALELIRPAQDPKFGDYQANFAMSLGKQLGRPPREIAQETVARLQVSDLCHPPEVSGPGFINLRLLDSALAQILETHRMSDRAAVPRCDRPLTYIVDYSSPNVAKSMHVGHIRSTVIGDALCRILRFLGHHVVSDNHLGDWGTQFGMILYGYRHFLNANDYEQQPVVELGRVYRVVRQIMDYHEAVRREPELQQRIDRLAQSLTTAEGANDKKAAKALRKQETQLVELREELAAVQQTRAQTETDPTRHQLALAHWAIHQAVLEETAKLHAGDPENLRLWREFMPKCQEEIDRIYTRLNIHFDETLGESFYHDRLAAVVEDLQRNGLASVSEGATCVFVEGFETPMIVRKKDGAFLYATTDLATIQYRVERWNPQVILYVVDFRQGEHFQKLFATARRWGYVDVDFRHIEFGTVLGDDGKPFRTRAGDTVGLEGLLDAAVARARQVVSENDDAKKGGRELTDAQRDHIAHVVGHAAIKYADLSQNRSSDYVYSEEKMVALKGNTATYLQYSYARVTQIFARGQIAMEPLLSEPICWDFAADKERQLALAIARFAESLDEVVIDYRPNLLTTYLYGLATLFSEFYEACPVLKADHDSQRQQRLMLCALVSRTLRQGLSLLGIDVVDKM